MTIRTNLVKPVKVDFHYGWKSLFRFQKNFCYHLQELSWTSNNFFRKRGIEPSILSYHIWYLPRCYRSDIVNITDLHDNRRMPWFPFNSITVDFDFRTINYVYDNNNLSLLRKSLLKRFHKIFFFSGN